jgi:beta-lactamase superfamily II metal-dependent hydrolase
MKSFNKNFKLYFLGTFLIINFFIWGAVFAENRAGQLTVAFLDIGQGDAIFIEAPNGNQILIDGGPNKKILSELSKLMPFYDRSIDMVIASHPDKDHIGGLPEVLSKFYVETVLEPGVSSNTAVYKEFENVIKNKNIKKVLARRGMKIWIDKNDGIYLDILFPNRDTTGWNTNDASIVARLVYKNSSFVFTGDSPQKIERYLAYTDGKKLKSDVLKLGHHGSKTSTSKIFLGSVFPQYAIISAGLKNRYGHPHKETLDLLKKFEIPFLETSKEGTIIFKTDGDNLYVK